MTAALRGQLEEVLWIQRIAQGDEIAARDLFVTHSQAVFRFVRRRLRGVQEDAEEIVTDTFLAAAKLAPTFDGSCSALTWLCSLARGAIADHLRPGRALKRIPRHLQVSLSSDTRLAWKEVRDPSVPIDDLVDRLDQVRLVQALLDSMSIDQREAVLMRYVEGFSVAEIALLMKRSERAVERLLERAKEKPREEISRWMGEGSMGGYRMDRLLL